MGIKVGLVGLPNVGKSTLFNALTKSSVPAENYPFCTIDPHIAITNVPDKRIDVLQKIFKSEKVIAATVTFTDIAGLVKGAASGEGLGNQFLSNIREANLILHVMRCFKDINFPDAELDPTDDYDIVVSELILKDLDITEKRLEKVNKLLKVAVNKPTEIKKLTTEKEVLISLTSALNNEEIHSIRSLAQQLDSISLLSAKNYLVIANLDESEIENYKENKFFQMLVKKFGEEKVIPISAKIEYELAQLSDEEAEEMANMIGIKTNGLDQVISKSYKNLDLITFFTCGPKEIHAWPIEKGITIRTAAGEIHSDLEKGFICAEVYNYKDILETQNLAKLKELGKIKIEGQNYIVQDGDIINIRFNV